MKSSGNRKKQKMKKILLLLLFLTIQIVRAGEFTDKGVIIGWKFAPLQVDAGFISNKTLFDESSDTFLSIGLFLLQQKSAVISVAPVANTLQNNYGLQINPVLLGTVTDNNYGISFGLENYCKNCYGIQIGVLNHSFAGDEICKENERFQFCGVNIADAVYLGIANFSNEFQIGLFNFSKEATFQLGLLNYNPKSHIPWLPLVNWDMGREE